MATIDSPDFPVISWDIAIPSSYFIAITRNSVTKRVSLNPAITLDGQGNYLIRGYGQGAFNSTDPDTFHLAAVLAEAINYCLTEPPAPPLPTPPDPRLPDGGFNLPSFGTVSGSYTSPSTKRFPTIVLSYNYLLFMPFAITVNFDFLGGGTSPEYRQFGFLLGPSPWIQTFPIGLLAPPASVSFIADAQPDGVWAPDNYICYEDRNFQRDTIINSSAFNTAVYRTQNWSSNRELMVLSYPVVNAEFIFLYRRQDIRFSQNTIPTDTNNLLETLFGTAQRGQVFYIYWNDTSGPEYFSIQDPNYVQDFANQLEDATGRGRAWNVTIPFVKY
jgi:hypothetical protein